MNIFILEPCTENHWKPLETTMRTIRNALRTIRNHWEPLGTTDENHWEPLETIGNHYNHWEPLRTIGKHWEPLETIREALRTIGNNTENHWEHWQPLYKPLRTIGNHWLVYPWEPSWHRLSWVHSVMPITKSHYPTSLGTWEL